MRSCFNSKHYTCRSFDRNRTCLAMSVQYQFMLNAPITFALVVKAVHRDCKLVGSIPTEGPIVDNDFFCSLFELWHLYAFHWRNITS